MACEPRNPDLSEFCCEFDSYHSSSGPQLLHLSYYNGPKSIDLLEGSMRYWSKRSLLKTCYTNEREYGTLAPEGEGEKWKRESPSRRGCHLQR